MNTIKKPYVIAIAAVSGGGKTATTKLLNEKLCHSKALYFDDYDFEGPESICEWVEKGADSNLWDLTPLVTDLQLLVSDQHSPLNFILLDYPFAYSHQEMNKFIDFAIFIDTPLDIALARRILRDFTDVSVADIQNDVQNYLHRGRFAYLNALRTTKPSSDLIVDGTYALETIVDKIMREVKDRFE